MWIFGRRRSAEEKSYRLCRIVTSAKPSSAKPERRYKAGDIVKVWSLQSFYDGGFINGTEGVVKQDQICDSVIVAVERNMGGTMKVDLSYEVYEQQLKLVHRPEKRSSEFRELIDRIRTL